MRVLVLTGDAVEVLQGERIRSWLQAGVPSDATKKDKRRLASVRLFCSDRPFNTLKEANGGGPHASDNMADDTPSKILAGELGIASKRCRFLSRVGRNTEDQWLRAYLGKNLNRMEDFIMIRDSSCMRGDRHDTRQGAVYKYVHFIRSKKEYCLKKAKYESFHFLNKQCKNTSTTNAVIGVKFMPHRYRVSGDEAQFTPRTAGFNVYEEEEYDSDDDDETTPVVEEVEDDKEARKFYRYEVS